jgi:TRAP transporter TAXI family solute receptor
MVAVFIVSVIAWEVTRDKLPREIRIATAPQGGLYYKFAQTLGPHIRDQISRPVVIQETEGSSDNRERLLDGRAELAILQCGAVPMDGLAALAPLYRDVLFVVVRKGRGINEFRDLAARQVAVGLPHSGMRASSMDLLEHYDISRDLPRHVDRYFLDLLDDQSLDAAIVTTGFTNPDLETLLGTGLFDILEIHEADAFCLRHPSHVSVKIPRGLYGHGPAAPPRPIQTVATTAMLAARADAPNALVTGALNALYNTNVRSNLPTLMTPAEAMEWSHAPMHPAARMYLDPYGGIDTLASFMESLAAGKELLFALAAGMYLLWDRYRRIKERERSREVRMMKDRLDALLADTARIEQAQMEATDPHALEGYLNEVTRIKLQALEELTHEDLRGDRMFLIFLIQCGNVINKIQAKMSLTVLRQV